MENTVATASRNLLAIKRRKFGYYAFRGLQVLARRGRSERPDDVALYPAVDDAAALAGLLNRLGWYLPEDTLRPEVTVSLPTDLDPSAAAERTPDGQRDYETDHLPVEYVPAADAASTAATADAILLWDADSRITPTALRNLPKLEVVDPSYYSGVESYTWGAFTAKLREMDDEDDARPFRDLEARAESFDRSFVFATGPSLDRATDFEFHEDELAVVCNSIVKNDDLLAHIDPDVLVFGDPVFHFGPSEYAATFRADAVETLRTYDCVGFVPERHRSLFAGHYPDLDLVGLRGVDVDEPIYPTAADRRVMSTNNIMTWFMLPIASALTDEVYVLGADGREEDESYFWEHNDDAQYDDALTETAVDCHPSFFRDRVYTDYYDQHCETLADFMAYGESQGIDYYSLTHSYVDAFAARRVEEIRRESTQTPSA